MLLDIALPRTLDAVVARFSDVAWSGARVEAWLFEDAAARRAAEATLAERGVIARLRSAYKPLLHAFLEGGLPAGPVRLPCHPAAVVGRFALEAYPLAGLMPVALEFLPGAEPLDYVLGDGAKVFAPNRVGEDAHGREVLGCCGWLRVWRGAERVIDAWLETEFEQCFAAVKRAVAGHSWPETTPLFPTLLIEVTTGGINMPLGLAHECVDTREALHEDLYFSLIEYFQARAGLEPGARTLQPGQIVPDIRKCEGPTGVVVRLLDRLAEPERLGREALDGALRALDAVQVDDEMRRLGCERFAATSVQGREITGLHRDGTLPGLVVTAGQHANETSGVVGLLRAAPVLLRKPRANVALVALENPDGYAVHRLLCAANPRHMHHAARYTALGDDLEARQAAPWYEAGARREAISRTGARLHMSLHGYPAQEWTRPLSGYVPSGFGSWTLPCGFFLILRFHPGLEAKGLAFLEALCAELAKDDALVAMNRAQLALRAAHMGADDTLVLHDIPCRLMESTRSVVPFTLITEYPDETIVGSAFLQAHTVQMATVLAAARLLWDGMLE